MKNGENKKKKVKAFYSADTWTLDIVGMCLLSFNTGLC